MGAPTFPKAGDWRPSDVHRFAVVSDRRVARSSAVNDPDYYGGHLVAEVSSSALVHLVAAAPDLAEALEKAAEHLNRAGMVTFRDGEISQSFLDAAEAARLALSKARGETE